MIKNQKPPLRCCQRRDPSEDWDSDEENVVIIKQKRLRFADEVQENEEVEELKGILKNETKIMKKTNFQTNIMKETNFPGPGQKPLIGHSDDQCSILAFLYPNATDESASQHDFEGLSKLPWSFKTSHLVV